MKRTWLILALVVVAAAVLLALRKREPPQLPFTKAKRETLVATLPTNGKVEPLEWQPIRVETTGRIIAVPVHQGQTIPMGALIASLSEPGLREELESAESRAAQATADLDTLRSGGKSTELADIASSLDKANFEHQLAQRDYDALKRLVDQQAATQLEVQTAKQRIDAADLLIASLERRRAALVSANDIRNGQARVNEALSKAKQTRAKLGVGEVHSPLAGTVYSLPVRVGAFVNAGDLIANVGQIDHLRVKVFVDEPELGRVHVGLPVRITWDGLPDRSWDGTVERLPTEIVALNTRQVGEVWCTISNQDHDLAPGANVNAEIRTDVAQGALTLPKAAIRRDRGPEGVFVLRGERLAWQPIKTGASSITATVIREGVNEGDLVLMPTDSPVKEGDKVRPIFNK